jgi:hypothetical protein
VLDGRRGRPNDTAGAEREIGVLLPGRLLCGRRFLPMRRRITRLMGVAALLMLTVGVRATLPNGAVKAAVHSCCCDDPTCPPGCTPKCAATCLPAAKATAKVSCCEGECCPDGPCCPGLFCDLTQAKATVAAKKKCCDCPPCPFCP